MPGRVAAPTVSAPSTGPADERRETPRAITVLLVLAVVLAVAPIAAAALRAVAQGWRTAGDDAFIAIRSHDVFSLHPPLVGPWSSASVWAHHDVALPGALQDYLLAVPVRVFGMDAGIPIGMALLNGGAVVGIAWLTRRRLGPVWAIVAMVFTASLAWSVGAGMLFDPWQPHASVFAFALFLFAAWSIADGDRVGLPVAAVTGSYVVQTHPSHVVLVPLLALVGIAVGWRAIRHGGLRWLAWSGVIVAVCWIPPLVQQVTTTPGNLTQLLHAAHSTTSHLGPRWALRVVGSGIALPPFWLPSSWTSLRGTLDAWWVAGAALAVLTAGIVWLARAAARRSDRGCTTLLIVAGTGLAGAVATIWNTPSGTGFNIAYVRWMWPLGMFIWFGLTVSVARLAAPRLAHRAWSPRVGTGAGIAVTAALTSFAVATVVATSSVTASHQWAASTAEKLAEQARPFLRAHDDLVVLVGFSPSALDVAPALMRELAAAGIPFRVAAPSAVLTLGSHRRARPGEPGTVLRVVATPTPNTGERRIAADPGLSRSDARRLTTLTDHVRAALRVNGGVVLTATGRHLVATNPLMRASWARVELIRTRPDVLVTSIPFAQLVADGSTARPLVDAGPVARGDLQQWARLGIEQQQRQTFLDTGPFS